VSKPVRLLISFVAAVVLAWLVFEETFTLEQGFVLFLVFFSIGLWVSEAAPPFAVALMIMASLVFTLGYEGLTPDTEAVKIYTDTFSSSVIWLLLGGYFLAAAITKTGLDAGAVSYSMKILGSNPRKMLYGMMIFAMFTSMFLSNTTTTAMVLASLVPMIDHFGRESPISKALVLGIPVAATIGGMGMVIGCPGSMLTSGAIHAAGYDMGFLTWMLYGMPLMVCFTLLMAWTLSRHLIKGVGNFPQSDAGITTKPSGSRTQRLVVLSVLVVTIGFWVSSPLHGINASAISAIPLVILPMANILDKKDVQKMGWDALILIAGGLALGEGLNHSGLLQIYSERIASLPISPLMLMIAMSYLSMIMSNIMGATATAALLLPAGISLFPQNVVGISMIIGLATSIAVLLPVSSPPNAIAYNTGIIKQSDFLIAGKLVALIGPALIVLWVLALL